MRLQGHRLEVDLPPGWEGRIYRRRISAPGSTTQPVMHAATFPLPEERGDFGAGAVEQMGPGDVFVSLVEYDPEAAHTALFARRGMPRELAPESFGPNRLQRAIPGQAGAQFFFSEQGRAFCLYVVLGSFADRSTLLVEARAALETLRIEGS
ncbi:MAG: hypothetical protein M3N51_05870 [Actinomycetota bacterium]|nr:hypothetical protein [Actinomycetota bacterium]